MNQAAHKPKQLTDPADIMIEGCRREHVRSQEQLYRFYYPEMIKICCRYAGDMDGAGIIYNNTMLRVFKNIRNYKHEGKLAAWIRTILVNCCIDYVKQQNKFSNRASIDEAVSEVGMDSSILGNVSAKEIQSIISRLPGATSAVFNLYIYENFTHKQIGQALGISDGTSKWHMNEARKRLTIMLKEFLTP